METKKEILIKLKNRFEELKLITKKGFKTSKELQDYRLKNIRIFEEYYDLGEQIEKLEYELLTPKERKEYDEYRRLSKLKAEGKFPL
jgi:division protein CdvB (Snf7/Vps24/ESCRT-III family)